MNATIGKELSPSGHGIRLVWVAVPAPTYEFGLTCPQCGADVIHEGRGNKYSWQQAAAVTCSECPWSGAVNVEVIQVHDGRQLRRGGRVMQTASGGTR